MHSNCSVQAKGLRMISCGPLTCCAADGHPVRMAEVVSCPRLIEIDGCPHLCFAGAGALEERMEIWSSLGDRIFRGRLCGCRMSGGCQLRIKSPASSTGP